MYTCMQTPTHTLHRCAYLLCVSLLLLVWYWSCVCLGVHCFCSLSTFLHFWLFQVVIALSGGELVYFEMDMVSACAFASC